MYENNGVCWKFGAVALDDLNIAIVILLKQILIFFLSQNHAQFLKTFWLTSMSKTKLDTETLEKAKANFSLLWKWYR